MLGLLEHGDRHIRPAKGAQGVRAVVSRPRVPFVSTTKTKAFEHARQDQRLTRGQRPR